MKILVFTEKPFAPAAVEAISNVVNASGNDLEVVEKGSREDLLNAVKDANGLIVRSDVIDDAVMNAAHPGAMVQHCLPAHRGEEITAEVFEAHADEIFDEAENRLHAQKAVMYLLMKD